MNLKTVRKFFNSNFNIFTSVISLIISILYFVRGISEGFIPGIIIVISMNLIYIPLVFIFKRQGFSVFYLIYVINYIINLIKYKDFKLAYRNLLFETEAYNNQNNLEYLNNRKHYA